MRTIAISSGHGKYIRGASGSPVPPELDEVNEARRVVDRVYQMFQDFGLKSAKFHDDTSHDQNTNLNTIVDWHNKQSRDLDVSVHFNATEGAYGTEVWWKTQKDLASTISAAMAKAGGFKDRGQKHSDNLFFLNSTAKPAVLLEVCFCDSTSDSNLYNKNFEAICKAIAETTAQISLDNVEPPETPDHPPPLDIGALFKAEGKCSHFGGPDDTGVSPSEGLAFIYNLDEAPDLFLPYQPEGTTGLARRLNPWVHYIACRWDYAKTSKEMLKNSGKIAEVSANGITLRAFPADWGPNENTGRVADLSPKLMEDLGLTTDDRVTVVYPDEGGLIA